MLKVLVCFLCLIPLGGFAQTITITGSVLEGESKKNIEFATIKLLRCSDSSFIAGANSKNDGSFSVSAKFQTCLLAYVKFVGFEPLYRIIDCKEGMDVYDIGALELNSIQQLKEVKLSADLEILKAGIDKKIYNVSEDLTTKGGSANDILNRLPSVEVDQEGNVLLRGEGRVTILIDGKQSSMSGGNGETLLDALPAGSIERIEIVTNPSAKYDPDGTSGIINIVLKKNKIKGFNLFYTSNIGSGNIVNGNSAETNLGLAYRNGKINIYGSYNLNYYEGYRNNFSETNQRNADGSFFRILQSREGGDLSTTHTFKTGLDYTIDQNKELSVSFSGMNGVRNRSGDLWNSLFDENNNRSSLWRRESYDPSQNTNFDADLFYKNTFLDKKGELTFNVHQSFGGRKIQGFYEENYYSPDSVFLGIQPLNQQLFNEQDNSIFSAQVDMNIVFPEAKGRMESGLKVIHGTQGVTTYSEQWDTLQGMYVEDTLANFIYAYNEKVYSAYALFGQQLGKFKYQAGVRGEVASQIPNLISENVLINNAPYVNLFPSAHLRYQIADGSEISFGYSKRINRPSSRNMNPFTNYSDPFNLRRGNPYLKPEYVDSYDAAWILDNKNITFSFSTYYRYSKGVISRIKEYYEDNTSAATYRNIAKTHGVGSELFSSVKMKSWWKLTASWNGNYIWYFAQDNNELNRSGFYHNFKINSSFEFWNKTASLQISHVYNGKRVTLQGIAQRKGPTDIAFEKKFNDSKWSVGCRVSDVFNVLGFYLNINQPNVTQVSTYKWLTRRYYLTVTYKFGKVDKKIEQKASAPPSSE